MFSDLIFRLRALFRRTQVEAELDDELKFHVEHQVESYVRSGLTREDAERRARFSFGGMDEVKEQCRDARGTSSLETLAQDLRYGLRMLRKNPGFSSVAVLTLAVGIGANSAIFSVVDAVLLHPLPYPDSERLVMVWENVQLSNYHNDQNTPAPGNFADWKTQNSVFTDMGAMQYSAWNLTGHGEPIRIFGEVVSSNIFPILGVRPAIGRLFTPEEDQAGANRVAILGHALWLSRFGADPGLLGRTVLLDDQSYTVIGVMPADFRFPDPSNFQVTEPEDQLWTPIALTPDQLANRGSHFLRVLARLKPGVTVARAQSQMEAISRRIAEVHPDSNTGVSANVVLLRDRLIGDIRPALLVILGAVSLVLLMVCANVAHLVLARTSARGGEFAIRLALGASRSRLVSQLLTECLLMSLPGGGIGLILAVAGVRMLLRFAPANLPRVGDVSLNLPVLLFTLLLSLAAGFIFGTIPALQASRRDVHEALRDTSREHTSGSRQRARSLLVVAETAIGVVVVIGAGLLLRSFLELERIQLGFDPDKVLSFRVVLPEKHYPTLPQRSAFYQRFAQSIQALPGVSAAASISWIPLTLSGRTTNINIEGKNAPPGPLPFIDFRGVTPGYFRAMQIPLIEGREVAWSDTPDVRNVAVISRTAEETFWPNESAIGKRVKLGGPDSKNPWITIVGVAGDVHQLQLIGKPRPAIYLPVTQDAGTGDIARDWVVRADRDPSSMGADIRAVLRSIDETLPLSRIQTMRRVVSGSMSRHQFSLFLFSVFAIVALILAAVGLYGLTSYTIVQRMHELGIRMALGAQRADILRLVLRHGFHLASLGVGAGFVVAFALSGLLNSLLYGVTSRDPATFASVGALLMLVALIASYIPSRRAVRVDPIEVLRHE